MGARKAEVENSWEKVGHGIRLGGAVSVPREFTSGCSRTLWRCKLGIVGLLHKLNIVLFNYIWLSLVSIT